MVGTALVFASIVSLALPVVVVLGPVVSAVYGRYTVGMSADMIAIRFLTTAGIGGGAGLVGGIWLAMSGRQKK